LCTGSATREEQSFIELCSGGAYEVFKEVRDDETSSPTRETRALPDRRSDSVAVDQSQSPQDSKEAASVQTPDLVSPRTTTITSRPGREPLAIRQCPAASV
jgi:hypothetical protein